MDSTAEPDDKQSPLDTPQSGIDNPAYDESAADAGGDAADAESDTAHPDAVTVDIPAADNDSKLDNNDKLSDNEAPGAKTDASVAAVPEVTFSNQGGTHTFYKWGMSPLVAITGTTPLVPYHWVKSL